MPRKFHKNKVYSAELKLQAVRDYLSGKGSLRAICKKTKLQLPVPSTGRGAIGQAVILASGAVGFE